MPVNKTPVTQRATPTARYYMNKLGLNFKGMIAKYGEPKACPSCSQVTFGNLEGGQECPCCDTCYDFHPYADKATGEKSCPVLAGNANERPFYSKH